MLLLCALIVGSSSVCGQSMTIDFESDASTYTKWTFTNMESKKTHNDVTPNSGTYFGTTGGKASASLVTKSKIARPTSIKFYISKQSINTTETNWYVKVSSDGSTWEQVGDAQAAQSMTKGEWVEVTRNLSTYSNVYVKIDYIGGTSTATRCIDDVTLSYDVTVNPIFSATINTDYEWLGVEKTKNLSAFPKEIECDGGLKVTISGNGTKARGDEGYIRLYATNNMKFTAPDNHFIKTIEFTVANSKWDNAFNVDEGSWNNNTKTWSCGNSNVSEVTLTESGTSGNNQISKIVVTLMPYMEVTVSNATWASYSSSNALDFTSTDVTAYIAIVKDNETVTLTEITKVPANTGIVVNAAAGSYVIPVLSGDADATTGNLLKPWLTSGKPSDTETTDYYTLAVNGDKNPIFKKSSGGTLAGGKSYLVMPTTGGAPQLSVDFGEGTTNLEAIRTQMNEAREGIFDLSGRRVENPTKGIYIVNGKKIYVK